MAQSTNEKQMEWKLKGEYYKKPTPIKMRKLGDSILIAGPLLQSAIMGLPLTETQKIWVNFSITISTLIGKLITNFFTEDSQVTNPQISEAPPVQNEKEPS